MQTTNKLSKKEFTSTFVKALEKRFKFKTYWSGKESDMAGLKRVTGNYHGWSYTGRKDAPIVMRFRGNQRDTLSTLVHEYAHSVLHRVGTEGFKLCSAVKEIEAETVARGVMGLMGVQLKPNTYIPRYQEKFVKKNGYEYKMINRKHLIDDLIKEIYETLKPFKQIAQTLTSGETKESKDSGYKYQITCTCCGNIWLHKRMTKVIKLKGKGCYCVSCGKKSKDKLAIIDLKENRVINAVQKEFTEKDAVEFVEELVKQNAPTWMIEEKVENLTKDNALEVAYILDVDTLLSRDTLNYHIVDMIEWYKSSGCPLADVV